MSAVPMPRVIIESPLSGPTKEALAAHVAYAKRCLLDSLSRGEAPFASHLLYAQEGVLNDDSPDERALGMQAGFEWGTVADFVAVYTDYGISRGMLIGISLYKERRLLIVYRTLNSCNRYSYG